MQVRAAWRHETAFRQGPRHTFLLSSDAYKEICFQDMAYRFYNARLGVYFRTDLVLLLLPQWCEG